MMLREPNGIPNFQDHDCTNCSMNWWEIFCINFQIVVIILTIEVTAGLTQTHDSGMSKPNNKDKKLGPNSSQYIDIVYM